MQLVSLSGAGGLIHFSAIKKLFLRLKRPGEDDANGLAVGAINAEDARTAGGHPKIEIASVRREARGIGQKPDGERILKGFFDVLDGN